MKLCSSDNHYVITLVQNEQYLVNFATNSMFGFLHNIHYLTQENLIGWKLEWPNLIVLQIA